MRRLSVWKLVLFGGAGGLFAFATAHCQARTYITCTGLCENVLPPCNISGIDAAGGPYDECIAFCTKLQDRCESAGRRAVFLDYIACATDAGFSCTTPPDAGDSGGPDASFQVEPVANAPCGLQQAELIQCELPDAGPDADAKLDLPDHAYEAGSSCPDAGSCLACCEAAYSTGAREFRNAVTACVCGSGVRGNPCTCFDEAGLHSHACGPAAACAAGVCHSPPVSPVAGDSCDQCLTSLLNEQTSDAGACVKAVTSACNTQGHVECALYMNCVSQAGCTN